MRFAMVIPPGAKQEQEGREEEAEALHHDVAVFRQAADGVHETTPAADRQEQKQQRHAGDDEHHEHMLRCIHLFPFKFSCKNIPQHGKQRHDQLPDRFVIHQKNGKQRAHMKHDGEEKGAFPAGM